MPQQRNVNGEEHRGSYPSEGDKPRPSAYYEIDRELEEVKRPARQIGSQQPSKLVAQDGQGNKKKTGHMNPSCLGRE